MNKPVEQELSFIGIIIMNIIALVVLADKDLVSLGFYFVFTIFCIALLKYYVEYSRDKHE